MVCTVGGLDAGWFEPCPHHRFGLGVTIMRDAPTDIKLKRAEGMLGFDKEDGHVGTQPPRSLLRD